MSNDKSMNPLSGDIVETDGVYQDMNGHEVELKAGEEFPMDPQLGKMEYEMVGLSFGDKREDMHTDEGAAAQANIPVSAVNSKDPEARQAAKLHHRRHGGER